MRYRNPDRRRDATLFDSLTASLREAEYARRCIELLYVVDFCLSQRGIIGIDCS